MITSSIETSEYMQLGNIGAHLHKANRFSLASYLPNSHYNRLVPESL